MSLDVLFGLRLSAIGLGVTFVALGLLSLAMRGLLLLFPAKKVVRKMSATADDEQHIEEMAVALAVGISLLEREDSFESRDPNLGQLLEK